MYGQKKRRRRQLEGSASINDIALTWELISEPQWSNSGDGYKGLCISVKVTDAARRELIIEYPYPAGKDGRPLPVPQRPPVSQALVEVSIQQAFEAGWEPNSRGKPFVFHAAAAAP